MAASLPASVRGRDALVTFIWSLTKNISSQTRSFWDAWAKKLCTGRSVQLAELAWFTYYPYSCPSGLTFSWWECYGFCLRQKPVELAHSFYSVLVSISVFMALSPVFHSITSPENSPLPHCSSGLISALLVLSTIYIFMKVSLSPNIIFCGWLGLKHQLTI